MIKLDNKYRLQNNNTHGVELVFEETRVKLTKDNQEKEYQFTDTWYYPNPVLAIKKWIELTSANVKNLDELILATDGINKNLDAIYHDFKNLIKTFDLIPVN